MTRPDAHLGEQAPWPFESARHAGHARLRRACAALMGFAIVAAVSYVAVSRLAEWLAERVA